MIPSSTKRVLQLADLLAAHRDDLLMRQPWRIPKRGVFLDATPKTNIEPEHGPVEEDIP